MTKKPRRPEKGGAVTVQTFGTSPSISRELFPPALLRDIRLLIDGARRRAAAAVNSDMVTLYWSIGERVRKDILASERAAYGEQIVDALSRQLSWTHLRQLIYLEDPLQREFYTQMCRLER